MSIDHTTLLAILGGVCSTLFGLLCALLGYGGTKIIAKLDQLYERVDGYVGTLHTRINGIDTRLTIIETRCRVRHNDPAARRNEDEPV